MKILSYIGKTVLLQPQVQATESLQGSVDVLAAERDSLQRHCQELEGHAARAATEHLEALERLVRSLSPIISENNGNADVCCLTLGRIA